ncbi:DUF4942 domain-containing protein [Thioalkalivibrio thiocyanodenitrificans]|uniref:DUF4942 domain-containing protein n=1 Tax=Thioalkalivibrio thiocyanodenitrificans TaxID=243063 RepID=UPI0003808EE9|nr:DUF4942 domain-containing protein [Thioalkalivibrio thiocyanodenitrificans]
MRIIEAGSGGGVDLAEHDEPFFAPADTDALDVLVAKYDAERANLERVEEFMASGEMRSAVSYFMEGADIEGYAIRNIASLFQKEPAIGALNSAYWQRALNLTDVMDFMPSARRTEWYEQIKARKTPEFTSETVRATINTLLNQRAEFLAEMVDGIFYGLSGEHVTNQPEGFSKRMIIDYVVDSYGFTHRKSGLIHDLRFVIAKFMGRDHPFQGSSMKLIEHVRKVPGQWNWVDGGAFRIRIYKKGTAHLEVHPHLAYRLNQILSHRYPNAIPSQFRKKPEKIAKDKTFVLIEDPIPFSVLKVIADGRVDGFHWRAPYDHQSLDKHIKRRVATIMEALGGAREGGDCWRFAYVVDDVIGEVLTRGMIPNHKSHQFYPTPEELAESLAAMIDIGPEDRCLEPSAGHGSLAAHLPKDRTLCVEVSPTHAKILEASGYEVIPGDFLEQAQHIAPVDVVLMNPPFGEGRAEAHLRAALGLLKPGGRLAAILPASMARKFSISGYDLHWTAPITGAFEGTGVSVVQLQAKRL